MQKVDAHEGPTCRRGMPLHFRDEETREAFKLSEKYFDTKLLEKLWNHVLDIPQWNGHPVWIHGDLHAGNLLAKNGKISGVVDFGSCGIGDPAVDLMVAWTLLTKETRDIFRSIIEPDENTWQRGYGWALTFGIVAYPYYIDRNPPFAALAKRAVEEVILDAFSK